MTTVLTLAGLCTPFALIAFGVAVMIRTTETDELIQQLSDELPNDAREDLLRAWLDELCNTPTEPTLEVRPS